jgi:hypothetical protein
MECQGLINRRQQRSYLTRIRARGERPKGLSPIPNFRNGGSL